MDMIDDPRVRDAALQLLWADPKDHTAMLTRAPQAAWPAIEAALAELTEAVEERAAIIEYEDKCPRYLAEIRARVGAGMPYDPGLPKFRRA